MDQNRRTSAVHLRDSSDSAAAGATAAVPAVSEAAEEALSINLLPSSYSAATPARSLLPRRHKRRGSSSAAAARETALEAPLLPSGGAQKRSGGSGGARPLASAPTAPADAPRGSRHYRASSASSGGGVTASSGTSSAAPAAASDGCRRLLRRTQRLLWTFWRRRRALAASLLGARSEIGGLSRLARYPLGRRLATAGAVLLATAFWFSVIVAVAGPATGGRAAGDNNKGDDNANGSGRDGDKGAADVSRSYYRRIPGEFAVGPSLGDPWMVRDIEIATADWGLEGGGGDASSEDDGRGGDAAGKDSTEGGEGEAAGSLGLGRRSGKRGTEWDGRVSSVVMGELEPVGTAKTRPKVDLLLTIFSGTTEADAAKRELLRQIYDKYEGWVKVGGPNSLTEGKNTEPREFTVSVVFVMSKETAPPEGELVGDILYVAVPEGYRNIVLKTKAMLCLVRHFDFEFLLKADDDSFVCLTRIASMLHDLDPEIRGKVYAGVPTACNQSTNPDYWNGRVMKNPEHRWFDSKYVQHTLGGLDCFPAYMQGAFYILAQPLVEHLYRGHEHLECFTNEDVTIGSWLMGVDREMVEMYNLRTSHLWDCLCARTQITVKTRKRHMFFHNCKGLSQLKLCGTRLLRPGVGC
ncbi:unnamed protein product [Ectocarpus sp. 6 AP-2014]